MTTAKILHMPIRRRPAPTQGSVAPPSPDGKGPAILLVEDDPADAKLFVWYAGKAGLDPRRITVAPSIAEAERRLASESFDLLVFDFWVGPDSSAQIIAASLARENGPPVVVLSNLSPEEMLEVYHPSARLRVLSKGELTAAAIKRAMSEFGTGQTSAPQGTEDRSTMRDVVSKMRATLDRLEGFLAAADSHLSSGDPEIAHGVVLSAAGQIESLKAQLDLLDAIPPGGSGEPR
ncbi:hypothetical protein [Prosthecomicrobium sp. N25]|uniref:hypothetical protein n=1 Tax=Prosthecomicrobium sp. N25 TaxID=3129254 RepID=UPI0030782A2B